METLILIATWLFLLFAAVAFFYARKHDKAVFCLAAAAIAYVAAYQSI